jgi:UDP-glucuronate decarboxylase
MRFSISTWLHMSAYSAWSSETLPRSWILMHTAHLQVVQEVVNPDAKIEFRDNTSDDPSRRKPDITKVRLSWHNLSCSDYLQDTDLHWQLLDVLAEMGHAISLYLRQAKKLLGWEPKVQLREGLASMVDDFKHRLHLEE